MTRIYQENHSVSFLKMVICEMHINFAEISFATKVHLVLPDSKSESRKWEELFSSLDPVGGTSLHLLLHSQVPLSDTGVLLLAPSKVFMQRLQISLNSQLVLKHLISAVDKTG